MNKFILLLVLASLLMTVNSKKPDKKDKPEWAKKDITDFTDADMERLLDQWEVGGTLND